MTIESFVKTGFSRRLEKRRCLVVYDPERRWASIALGLEGVHTTVVDASESIVLAREAAFDAWARLGDDPSAKLVVYIPRPRPKDDRSRQESLFAPFDIGGAAFPDGDADGYRELCLRAFPAQEAEVLRLFSGAEPSFDAVNGLAGGALWPMLRALLGVESEREMIVTLLAPPASVKAALGADPSWISEAKRLVASTLGYDVPGARYIDIRNALGRFLLFSEFVLDLPDGLPPSLLSVPRAAEGRKAFVYSVCETLRDSKAARESYLELAEKADASLGLADKFAEIPDLGERETFAFENRASLSRCVAAARRGDFNAAHRAMDAQETSVWYEHSPDIQARWACAREAVALLEGLAAFASIAEPRKGVEDYIRAYRERFAGLDAAYRGLEVFVAEAEAGPEAPPSLDELVSLARSSYFAAAEGLQRGFLQAVAAEPWLGPASTDQAAIFDSRVAPRLVAREKTAYFMVDALRFDLARELVSSFPLGYRASLDYARSRLPSVTAVGMAALLPGAASKLELRVESGALAPYLGGASVASAQERVAYMKSMFGDRVRDILLNDLAALKKSDLKPEVDLLIVRSKDIDTAGESLGAEALPLLTALSRNILRALERVRKLGFPRAVVVTDHGFLLLPAAGAGGTISKPDGAWEISAPRYLLGEGSARKGIATFDGTGAGAPGYQKSFATPAGLGSFVAGTRYTHGGLSLQECLLPVLVVDFPSQAPKRREVSVSLGYKGGMTRKVTTMRPAIDLSVADPGGEDLYGGVYGAEVMIALSVRSGDTEVGRAQPSAGFDPSSGCFKMRPGKATKLTLAMDEDFRGAFVVSAQDPVTLEQFAKIELETDYTE